MANQTDELLNMPGPGGTLPILTDTLTPAATPPQSSIDVTVPVYGSPTTQSVRDNFATAATEITALMQATQGAPFMPTAGGHFTGPVYLYNDPTDVMMPVTLGYFNAHGGAGTGGGGIPEAPADGKYYTRSQGAWVPGVSLSGGTLSQMTGELLLSGNPTHALGAVPKQYADAIATTANGAVPLAGGTMTGLLILSGDPAAALGAVTKQYADNALALKAPIASPTFTGIVTTTGGRVIVTSGNAPSLTLNNTTFNSPVFGLANSGNFFQIGIAAAATGNLTATLAMMDSGGNWTFGGRVNATSGRLIATSSNNPSIALNNISGQIWGLWSASAGQLAIGLTDANGTPGASPLVSVGTDGGLTLNGSLRAYGGNLAIGTTAGQDCAFSLSSGPQLNVGTTSTSPLAKAIIFATSTELTGNLTVDGSNMYLGGTGQLTAASGSLNISASGGGNLSGIGLFANSVTIVNGALTISGGGGITCGSIHATELRGGTNDAGVLRTLNATNSLDFRFASPNLYYRIDEALEATICTQTNAQLFGYAGGTGGPTTVSLNGFDINGSVYGIFVDAVSDRALKDNIADSKVDALALIRRLRLRSFDYTAEVAGDDPHVDLGLVAQEVAEIIPAMVPDTPFDDGLARINLKAAVPYLIRAVQQLAEGKK